MMPGTTEHAPPRSQAADVSAADIPATEEEARRPRHVALAGAPMSGESLVVRVGARFTSAFRVLDERSMAARIVSHGPVMLAASQAAAASANGSAAARVLRAAAQQVVQRAGLEILGGITCPVVGAAGIARAVITLGAAGASKATVEQVRGATDTLAATWVEGKKGGLLLAWVEPMMIGSAVLGAILETLGTSEIVAEAKAPREGTLKVD